MKGLAFLRNSLMAMFILALYAGASKLEAADLASAQPMMESQAYKKFTLRPKNEISKLSYLIDRFKDMDVIVIFEGHQYDAEKAAQYAKSFLKQNYKGQGTAESWVKQYVYRSEPSKEVIQFRFTDGTEKPARDILLNELEALNKAIAKGKKK